MMRTAWDLTSSEGRGPGMETIDAGPRPASPPRWGVVHLLAWTVGCALGFAAYRALSPPWPMVGMSLVLSWAYNLGMGVSLGTILTGAGILALRHWWGDRPGRTLPGHWLLLFGVAAAVADGVAFVVYRVLFSMWYRPDVYLTAYWLPHQLARSGPHLAGMYNQCVGWGLGAVAALAFCWCLRSRVPRPWFAAFLVFLLMASVLAGGAITVTVMFYGPSGWTPARAWFRMAIHLFAGFIILGALAIIVAVAWDRQRGGATDGLHRAGIAAWLAIATIQLALYSIISLRF